MSLWKLVFALLMNRNMKYVEMHYCCLGYMGAVWGTVRFLKLRPRWVSNRVRVWFLCSLDPQTSPVSWGGPIITSTFPCSLYDVLSSDSVSCYVQSLTLVLKFVGFSKPQLSGISGEPQNKSLCSRPLFILLSELPKNSFALRCH